MNVTKNAKLNQLLQDLLNCPEVLQWALQILDFFDPEDKTGS